MTVSDAEGSAEADLQSARYEKYYKSLYRKRMDYKSIRTDDFTFHATVRHAGHVAHRTLEWTHILTQ